MRECRQVKRHKKTLSTTVVPRMASVSGTELLRCMQPNAAEQQWNLALRPQNYTLLLKIDQAPTLQHMPCTFVSPHNSCTQT